LLIVVIFTNREILRMRIVILKGNSLLTEGVISRLMQNPDPPGFLVVDLRQLDALVQVVAAKPSVLILDETDSGVGKSLWEELWLNLPTLKVVLLDPQSVHVRMVQWDQQQAIDVNSLIHAIETCDLLPLSYPVMSNG
jgi:hypothetical protein